MSKIDGKPYKLAAVGLRGDVMPQADEINGQQWRAMREARWVVDGREMPREFSAADAKAARDAGKEPWISQYYYHWGETDSGAPARVKYATRDQLAKWSELAGWKDRGREGVCLLWQIETMPAKPTILRVNIKTGLPLVNQSPLGEQV
jgi:hypothetical protein